MDLEARKISFVQEFLRLQNEEIVSGLENLLHKKKAELIEKNRKPMSLEKYNDEIDQAMDDSKNMRMTKATDLGGDEIKYQELTTLFCALTRQKK